MDIVANLASSSSHDSRKATGYVGLNNQGATGSLNILLQSLFCTRLFRKAVYQIPTQDDDPTESTSLALQRLFYHLQTSDAPVDTVELTKSFGWESTDSFLRHHTSELFLLLRNRLADGMKGTKAEGAIAKLFAGKMRHCIRCIDIDRESGSSRIEEFTEIELNVRGLKTLYESFKDYIAVETLVGGNECHTEDRGVIFESLPPVLHLVLRRFVFDEVQDCMVMVNDRHEFPPEIDLAGFLEHCWQPLVYKLHGVFVHSGNYHNGRYYAFIKPDPEGGWLNFDNDRVTVVTEKDALEGNYGGDDQRLTKACVLVYIRASAINEVLAPLLEGDTPDHLKESRLDSERSQLEVEKRETEEQHLFLTVKIITDETFSRHEGFDLATFEEGNWPASDLPSFRVLKTETYHAFKDRVAKYFGYPESLIRLWVLASRQNGTIRPCDPVPDNDPSLLIKMICNELAARLNVLPLYLDIISDPSKPDLPPQSTTIFLKHFDPSEQTLHGVGKMLILRNAKVLDLIPAINERMRWAIGTSMTLYKEVGPGVIQRTKLTFARNQIRNGDIICFQVDLPETHIRDLKSQGLHSNAVEFFDFLENRIIIMFKPKFEEQGRSEFSLILSKRHNYDIMAAGAGEILQRDPDMLRFTTTHLANGSPKSVLRKTSNQTVAEITGPGHLNSGIPVILYEELDVSIVDLETKCSRTVTWTGIQNKEEGMHSFFLLRTSMVSDLVDQLSKLVALTLNGTHKIRIFEISEDRKTQKELTGTMSVDDIPELADLYAEEIPKEELEAGGSDKVINVFHFYKELPQTHGVPFKFVLKRGEKFKDTRKRLQGRIGASDQESSMYRVALILPLTFRNPFYIEDEDIVYDSQFAPVALGLDHVERIHRSQI